MINTVKDTRLRCPCCKVRTWMTDYSAFMRDHDRPDGKRCVKAIALARLDAAPVNVTEALATANRKRGPIGVVK